LPTTPRDAVAGCRSDAGQAAVSACRLTEARQSGPPARLIDSAYVDGAELMVDGGAAQY
jgi:hypothetical protein